MPSVHSIAITNFKGASSVKIDFTKHGQCPVTTLVGLNESGKTTILEAISYFVTGDNAVSSLFSGTQHNLGLVEGIIPIHRKAAFTDTITVSAKIGLEEDDIKAVIKACVTIGFDLKPDTFPNSLDVASVYEFEDSALKESYNFWDFEFEATARASKKRKPRSFSRPTAKDDARESDPWHVATTCLQRRMPRVAYFPTFLVDLPQRIYLGKHADERPVNRYYRQVFQDILDSVGEGLSLEKHVCKRIEDARSADGSPNWFSVFQSSTTKDQVSAVFQKLSSAVTREVLGSWERVFQRKTSAKSISIDWGVDTQKNNTPYASFYVSDGESRYAINERSLGFRWFFSFLLFTAFKQAKARPTLFLFDEPAANLHAKAQAELLTSFAKITLGGNRVVYSTHSHHMINPQWLSGAYIVENTAIDHDADDAFGLTTRPTDVVATPYRHFVSQYPTRTSYFQPVIEKLEYVVPELVGSGPFLVVEGITDFYALKIAQRMSGVGTKLSIMPGIGAGASDPTISSLLGRAEKFVLLLDDDEPGRRNCTRYRERWFLPEAAVFTLSSVDQGFNGKCLEDLISASTKSRIQDHLGKTSPLSKKEIGWYLAELCSSGDLSGGAFDGQTIHTLSTIISDAELRLSQKL